MPACPLCGKRFGARQPAYIIEAHASECAGPGANDGASASAADPEAMPMAMHGKKAKRKATGSSRPVSRNSSESAPIASSTPVNRSGASDQDQASSSSRPPKPHASALSFASQATSSSSAEARHDLDLSVPSESSSLVDQDSVATLNLKPAPTIIIPCAAKRAGIAAAKKRTMALYDESQESFSSSESDAEDAAWHEHLLSSSKQRELPRRRRRAPQPTLAPSNSGCVPPSRACELLPGIPTLPKPKIHVFHPSREQKEEWSKQAKWLIAKYYGR